MQQTLLALCAVLVFSIYALNTTRDEAAFERRAVTSGAEGAAAEVARGRLAAAERLAFDEVDVGRDDGGGGIRTTPTASPLGADEDETDPALYDDLDDLADHPPEERAAPPGRDADGLLRFTVTYAVRYVDPANPAVASAVPTLAKELTVSVVEVGGGRGDRPPVAAALRKVFTPAGMASFRRP